MRLKGQFRDPITFLKILVTMSKLSSRCLLRFSPEEIHFVIPKGTETCEAYAALDNVKSFFREYKVESNFNNQVNIECSIDHLCQALKQTNSASLVTMKLAKKGAQPTLSFDIMTRSANAQELTVSHDVSIVVKKPKDMEIIKTPDQASLARHPYYKIISSFPDLEQAKTVAEKMRSLDSTRERIIISANPAGELKLSVSGEITKAETIWKGMQINQSEDQENSQPSLNMQKRFQEVAMDAKTIVKVLSCPLQGYMAEIWLAPKRFATFLIHVRKQGADDKTFVAHLMITLPAISDAYDD